MARPETIQPISFAFSFAAVQARERKCGKLILLLSSRTFLPEKEGDEPIVLSFFIQDAEVGAWHRYENLVVQDLEDNFRSPKPGQFHAFSRTSV